MSEALASLSVGNYYDQIEDSGYFVSDQLLALKREQEVIRSAYFSLRIHRQIPSFKLFLLLWERTSLLLEIIPRCLLAYELHSLGKGPCFVAQERLRFEARNIDPICIEFFLARVLRKSSNISALTSSRAFLRNMLKELPNFESLPLYSFGKLGYLKCGDVFDHLRHSDLSVIELARPPRLPGVLLDYSLPSWGFSEARSLCSGRNGAEKFGKLLLDATKQQVYSRFASGTIVSNFINATELLLGTYQFLFSGKLPIIPQSEVTRLYLPFINNGLSGKEDCSYKRSRSLNYLEVLFRFYEHLSDRAGGTLSTHFLRRRYGEMRSGVCNEIKELSRLLASSPGSFDVYQDYEFFKSLERSMLKHRSSVISEVQLS